MYGKRLWSLITLIVIGSMLLVACGQGAAPIQEPAEPGPTDAPPPTEAPEEEPEPTVPSVSELTIWADELRAPILTGLAEAFEEQYGVGIVIEQYGFGDIRDNLKVAGPAGEGPDIIIGAHDWLGELVTNGLLAPIDLGDKADLFDPNALGAMTYEGELYGVPYATENLAFFYNPELVSEPPATWEEVEAVAEELEGAGEVQQGYILQQGDPYHFFPIMAAHGGYVFGRDAEGNYQADDVGIDSQGSIAAAAWLDRMVEEGHLQAEIDWDTMHSMFESGDAAMLMTGPWALSRIRDSGVSYAISKIPAGPAGEGQPFLGVQGFMVSAFSDDPLLAQVFLTEFVATDETMQELYEVGARAPAYMPVLNQLEDADLAAFADAGSNAVPMPAIPEMSAVWTAWGDAVTIVFQQQQEPDAAFENAAEQIRTAIEGE